MWYVFGNMVDYKKSGVDIDKGNELIDNITKSVEGTFSKSVINPLGGYASMFRLDLGKYKKPIILSSTDGVGTKLKLAFMSGTHNTIGIDLVAMSVNDLLVYGADPLFFLDYVAVDKLDVKVVSDIILGVVEGCKQAGCSLVGGETAEMPGFYTKGEYDCAGFAVGAVEEDKIIDGRNVKEGDAVIAIASSGVHSNGYSLVRYIFFDQHKYSLDHIFPELNKPLGEVLLAPTIIYVKPIQKLLSSGINVKSMAHITGGGIVENFPRVFSTDFVADVDVLKLPIHPIFNVMAKLGNVAKEEMFRVFNMGTGFMIIVPESEKQKAVNELTASGLTAKVVGNMRKVSKDGGRVELVNIENLKLWELLY